MISLTRRWTGGNSEKGFYLYRAQMCHGNTEVYGEGGTAEEAIKNMAEGVRDDWAQTVSGKEKPEPKEKP